MTQKPNENFFLTPKTEGEARDGWFIPIQRITSELVGGGESFPTYTIATGVIKPQTAVFDVATEGGAATDDLSQASISFDPGDGSTFVVPEGRVMILKANNDAQTVVIKHEAGGSGQFSLTNGTDLSLSTTKQSVAFVLTGTTWKQISFHGDPAITIYDPLEEYTVKSITVGSDGNIYYCYIANGASSPINPVGDVTGVWSTTPPYKAGEPVLLNHEPSANEMISKRILLADASYLLDSSYGQISARWGGKIFGGDGSGFYLPDFDAETIRFIGATSGPDSASRADRGDGTTGNAVGTTEADAMQKIRGELYLGASTGVAAAVPTLGVFYKLTSVGNIVSSVATGSNTIGFDSSLSTSPNPAKTSDTETRMKNRLWWGGIYY